MSRMTKFLKQTCTIERMVLDENGEAVLNIYGEPTYQAPIKVKCRRERSFKDVLTVTGAMKRSAITYYIDEVEPVQLGDLVDGKPIVDFEEYTNEYGKTEGYMVVV